VIEEVENSGFLSHSTDFSSDYSLPPFQEYAPWALIFESSERHQEKC